MKLGGCVTLRGGVKTGMIRIGRKRVFATPGNGFYFENNGTLVFNGSCDIGSDSYISIGKHGCLTINNGVSVTSQLVCICQYNITIKSKCLIGWGVKIFDTDFHQVQYESEIDSRPAYGAVVLGENAWVAQGCTIMKNAIIPDNCIVGACSLVNKEIICEEHTLIAGVPAKPRTKGVWLDRSKDHIVIPS